MAHPSAHTELVSIFHLCNQKYCTLDMVQRPHKCLSWNGVLFRRRAGEMQPYKARIQFVSQWVSHFVVAKSQTQIVLSR